jgi:hypothetical protein
MINTAADQDYFKFNIAKKSTVQLKAIPKNVGSGNSGANIDIKLTVLNSNGQVIGKYNPYALLSATADLTLNAGNYYVLIEGVANQNIDEYGSIGYYSLTGSVQQVAVVAKAVTLTGQIASKVHVINWTYENQQPIKDMILEGSENGVNFRNIQTLSPAVNHFEYIPVTKGVMYYRAKMVGEENGDPYYSNTISLQYPVTGNVSLGSNIIMNTAQVKTAGNYAYQLVDETGRLLQRGRLIAGMNNIPVNTTRKGILLLRVYTDKEQVLFRLIKQ